MRLSKCAMKDQKGVKFFLSNTLCSVSRDPAVNCCDEHMYIHTLLQEAYTTDLISIGEITPQSAALTMVMRHIAAQSVQSSTERGKEEEVEGWGGRKCIPPPVFPSLYLD